MFEHCPRCRGGLVKLTEQPYIFHEGAALCLCFLFRVRLNIKSTSAGKVVANIRLDCFVQMGEKYGIIFVILTNVIRHSLSFPFCLLCTGPTIQ